MPRGLQPGRPLASPASLLCRSPGDESSTGMEIRTRIVLLAALEFEFGNFQRTVCLRVHSFLFLVSTLTVSFSQVLAQAPTPKPAPQNTPTASPAVPSAVSKHYPILIIAHGNEPSWSLRLGMKGPERLDRANYPPIGLDPADVTRDESGTFWIYNSKDEATGANVAVKLTREPCSDAGSQTNFTFRVEVTHAQIGILNGCGQSSPDKFPEFRKKNQLDMPDDADAKDKDAKDKDKDKDKDKKTALDPIT